MMTFSRRAIFSAVAAYVDGDRPWDDDRTVLIRMNQVAVGARIPAMVTGLAGIDDVDERVGWTDAPGEQLEPFGAHGQIAHAAVRDLLRCSRVRDARAC